MPILLQSTFLKSEHPHWKNAPQEAVQYLLGLHMQFPSMLSTSIHCRLSSVHTHTHTSLPTPKERYEFLRQCDPNTQGGSKIPSVSISSGRDVYLILESGRSPGGGNGNPFHYSCLENPMDRGAWWATVHGAARVGHDST